MMLMSKDYHTSSDREQKYYNGTGPIQSLLLGFYIQNDQVFCILMNSACNASQWFSLGQSLTISLSFGDTQGPTCVTYHLHTYSILSFHNDGISSSSKHFSKAKYFSSCQNIIFCPAEVSGQHLKGSLRNNPISESFAMMLSLAHWVHLDTRIRVEGKKHPEKWNPIVWGFTLQFNLLNDIIHSGLSPRL